MVTSIHTSMTALTALSVNFSVFCFLKTQVSNHRINLTSRYFENILTLWSLMTPCLHLPCSVTHCSPSDHFPIFTKLPVDCTPLSLIFYSFNCLHLATSSTLTVENITCINSINWWHNCRQQRVYFSTVVTHDVVEVKILRPSPIPLPLSTWPEQKLRYALRLTAWQCR